MAYDEGLAERIRGVLEDERDLLEKKMFGGVCFMVAGRMILGIVKDELMVRVGEAEGATALAQPHARPMDFTGRPMKGFVFVSPEGFETDQRLRWWIERALQFARAVPPKPKRSRLKVRRGAGRGTAPRRAR